MKDNILAEAKTKADAEYQKKMDLALNDIKSREAQMLASLKAQSGQLALEIAEKVIRKELASDQTQQDFATKLVREVSMN
jgi:F-type H+-transporting ATPase subunit b